MRTLHEVKQSRQPQNGMIAAAAISLCWENPDSDFEAATIHHPKLASLTAHPLNFWNASMSLCRFSLGVLPSMRQMRSVRCGGRHQGMMVM